MIKTPSNISEPELIDLLLKQEERGMQYLYDNYSAVLYGVILKIVKSEEIGEEVLHDCFLRVWNKIGTYDPKKGRLFTWMVNIARNLAIDKIRSTEFIKGNKSKDISHIVSLEDTDYSKRNNPEHIGIPQLMDALNQDQKQLLELIYFQGYTQIEISDELEIPLGTVKTRIRSAIMKLRKLF